jgi:hypothetical protein
MTYGTIGRRGLLGGGLLVGAAAAALRSAAHAEDQKGEISVAYSASYVFGVDADAVQWWASIKQQFEAKFPGATLKLLPMDGTDVDMMTKFSLQFRSPATTPDVIQLPTTYVGQFASSNYLLPLDQYITTDAPFWSSFPANIQDEGRVDGKIYALVCGENNSGILYNIAMLRKAGIATPWSPKNWAEILDAARKVKSANPGIIPLWAAAGISAGTTGILQGSGALVYGSATPMMYDAGKQKWIVDSPGLREVLAFYRAVYSEGTGRRNLRPVFAQGRRSAAGDDARQAAGHCARVELVWLHLDAGERFTLLADCQGRGGCGTDSDLEGPGARHGRHARRLVLWCRARHKARRSRMGSDEHPGGYQKQYRHGHRRRLHASGPQRGDQPRIRQLCTSIYPSVRAVHHGRETAALQWRLPGLCPWPWPGHRRAGTASGDLGGRRDPHLA